MYASTLKGKQNDQKLDVVREYTEAVWSNSPSSATSAEATYLSDDFQNLDNDGNVLMDKKAYIGMIHLLFTAFKDFKWLQVIFAKKVIVSL